MTATQQPADLPSGSSTVRRATPADAATMQAMIRELAEHERFAHAVRTTAEDWSRMLADDGVVVLLAVDGDRPLGYVSAVHQLHLWSGGDILAMDDLYTRPEARGTGVGGRLMTALAEHAMRGGRPLIRWEMEVDNHGAQGCYRRLGAALRPKVIAVWQPAEYELCCSGKD